MSTFRIYSEKFKLNDELIQIPSDSQCLIVAASPTMNAKTLTNKLNRHFPNTQKHIATTSQGYFDQKHNYCDSDQTIGLFAICDSTGDYGSAAGPLSQIDQIEEEVHLILNAASLRAGRSGELPSLVWVSPTPGYEEKVIEAIQSYYQTNVPICGGSAADQMIEGKWWIADQYHSYTNGLALTVMYTQANVYTRLSSGYFLTQHQGVVTSCTHRRLYQIDHRPAATVYKEWIHGRLSTKSLPKKVLKESTYSPLAVLQGFLGKASYFQVIHPKEIFEDQSISTFADVSLGQKVYLLKGDEESVITRASRLARGALNDTDLSLVHVKGALIIFCAGCFMAVGHRAQEIRQSIAEELPDVPLLCQFTFGEQGVFPQGECLHGNLMISVTLFVDNPASIQ